MKIIPPIFAIVTPFEKDGSISFPALRDYLGFLEGGGVKTIIVCGTTGEFPSLSLQERRQTLEFCRERFKGGVICNISGSCISDCQSLLHHARNFSDAALLLPPYYYANTSQQGLFDFFSAILKESPVPVFLYNFPRHTNNPLSPELVKKLAENFKSLSGIKDSGGEFSISKKYKELCPELRVFVGGDTVSLRVLETGLNGSVTGAGNATPECLVGIYESFVSGAIEKARKWQETSDLWSVYRKPLALDEIPVIKAGICARLKNFPLYSRAPLSSLDKNNSKAIAMYFTEKILPRIAEK